MQIENIDTAAATPAAVAVLMDRKPLVAALSYLAQSIIEARNTIPIVSCVVLETCEAGTRMIGTDLDIVATCELPGAWEAPGSIVADVRALLAAVKACDGDTVNLRLDGNGVLVSGDGIASRVSTLPRDDFPMLKRETESRFFVVRSAELAHDWTRARASISTEETRYYLNGIFMHAERVEAGDGVPDTLTWASTDGHRLTLHPPPAAVDHGRGHARRCHSAHGPAGLHYPAQDGRGDAQGAGRQAGSRRLGGLPRR